MQLSTKKISTICDDAPKLRIVDLSSEVHSTVGCREVEMVLLHADDDRSRGAGTWNAQPLLAFLLPRDVPPFELQRLNATSSATTHTSPFVWSATTRQALSLSVCSTETKLAAQQCCLILNRLLATRVA